VSEGGRETGVAEHLFRHEAGRITAALVRVLGLHNLDLAEEVTQDTLLRALEVWQLGVPDDPAGWLIRVARNRAIDVIRRERAFRRFAPDLTRLLESEWMLAPTVDDAFFAHEIRDAQLCVMFCCAHPSLPPPAQVAVMLKTLCGFSVGESAHAFLVPETTIEKRLSRAYAELRTHRNFLDAVTGPHVPERLASVHASLYLLFNEGYHGSHPEHAVREELCGEAMRLCALLAEHPAGDVPRTHALFALFCFHAVRLGTRTDASGALQLLAEQDRSRWDRALIARGEASLSRASTGNELSAYHVEAAIAACHATAASFADTDWRSIVNLYDVLLRIRPSAVVALNRAIAVGYADGPAFGLDAIDALARETSLAAYPFLDAARGDFLRALGRTAEAHASFERAIARARNDAERELLARKLRGG